MTSIKPLAVAAPDGRQQGVCWGKGTRGQHADR